jgi:hypothetical protein
MRDASQRKFGPSGISSQISRLVTVEREIYTEDIFGKSWRSPEFLTKCRVFSRCQGIFENKFGGSGISAQDFVYRQHGTRLVKRRFEGPHERRRVGKLDDDNEGEPKETKDQLSGDKRKNIFGWIRGKREICRH